MSIFGQSDCENYRIGADEDGEPVFYNVNDAYKQMKKDYPEAIKEIKKEHNLFPLCKIEKIWREYMQYGAQCTTDDEELRSQCMEVSQFFDIYENSFN